MAFPRQEPSGTILGKPRTGLPLDVSFDDSCAQIEVGQPIRIPGGSDYEYIVWELSQAYGNVTGFYNIRTNQVWIWADCSRRWWTPDIEGFRIGSGPSTYVPGSLPGQSSQGGGSSDPIHKLVNDAPQAGKPTGLIWVSWDSILGAWIRKTSICDANPRQDDPYIPSTPFPVGKIYTQIDQGDKLPRRTEIKTYGIWTNGVGNLTTFHQCPSTGSLLPFHQTVYNKLCGTCHSEAQFDIAYGHDAGSGSIDLGGYDWLTPTNATYGQYRLLCLGRNDKKFKLGNRELDQVYIVNVRLARMQERLDEGNVELNLAHLSGSQFIAGGGLANAHTGSNVVLGGVGKVLRLIDDSRLNFDVLSSFALTGSYNEHADVRAHRVGHGGYVYYMVSGSLERGIHNTSNPHVYGLMYPQLGIMVLDATLLDSSASFGTVTGTQVAGDNASKLFTAISGAAQYTDPSGDVMGFQARRKETEFAEYYFIRVKNSDYNYSNNPTFITGSEGQIADDFIEEPKVYFTTVGLYNEQKECIAVGKVTRAIQKTCTSEALFKIRLKY